MKEILQNGLGQEYKCSREDVKIDTVTGRVYEVKFKKIWQKKLKICQKSKNML